MTNERKEQADGARIAALSTRILDNIHFPLKPVFAKTHIKKCFFSGRTTKSVRRVNPPCPLSKKHFFP